MMNAFRRMVAAAALSLLPSLAPAAEMEIFPGLSDDQKMIMIRGPIEKGDGDKFYALAQQGKRVTVFLESPGGLVQEGLWIGAEIATRGFATLVLDGPGCYSICAVIWVSGARPYMSPGAKIGVHAAYLNRNLSDGRSISLESGMANAEIGAYLNEVGLSIEAIRYFTMAGPNEANPITPEIAQRLDIPVSIQDGMNATMWYDRPTPRSVLEKVTSYAGLSNNCARMLGIDPELTKAKGLDILKEGHETFGGEVFADQLGIYTEQQKASLEKLGLPRWCLENERFLRSKGLPTFVQGPSFDCAKASTDTEIAICGSEDLWPMDRMMANLYFMFRANMAGPRASEFLDSQRTWLKRRNACRSDTSCLIERYSSRLFDFGT